MSEEKTLSNQTEETVQAAQEQNTVETPTAAHSEGRQNGATAPEMANNAAAADEHVPNEPVANEPVAAEAVAGEIVTDETVIEAEVDPTAQDKATIVALQAELAAAEAKNADLLDKLQRTAAEFQNIRRRQEKQLADEIERASSHIVQQLLPVVDDLELAFANVPAEITESSNAWLEGFRQIRKKLDTLLDDRGVVVIAKEGPFDPIRHEAISSEPSEAVESGHIIQTLRAGYEHKGRVLRPALVRVAM